MSMAFPTTLNWSWWLTLLLSCDLGCQWSNDELSHLLRMGCSGQLETSDECLSLGHVSCDWKQFFPDHLLLVLLLA